MIIRAINIFRLFVLLMGILFITESTVEAEPASKKTESLMIVTPFPRFITQEYQAVFKHHYPEIELNIVKMGSNEAIERLLKDRDENITDIFWASSP